MGAEQERNKQLARDMWQEIIVDYKPEAVLKYISPDYIQHDPAVPPGRQFLYEAVKELQAEKAENPNAKPHTTKRVIDVLAEGDLVVMVFEVDVPEPDDPSKTYVANAFDMLRYKDGVIVEHWDDIHKGKQY